MGGREALEEELEAELGESAASALLNSNADSNAGVAAGPLRFPVPRRANGKSRGLNKRFPRLDKELGLDRVVDAEPR